MAAEHRHQKQAAATRDALLDAAERLFAEHGVHGVGIRQISAAAGQRNNTAVSYHFGSKTGLIRTVIRQHVEAIERRSAAMIAKTGDSEYLRDWVSCAVIPTIAHIEGLEQPSWYARFIVGVVGDPDLRTIASEEFSSAGSSSVPLRDGLYRCVPDLPAAVRLERSTMTEHLINQTIAERERQLADGAPTARDSWGECAEGLIDALMGLWLAPVTGRP